MRIVAIRVSILGIFASFLFCVFQTYLPFNPLSLSKDSQFIIKALCPEGWGFFTKNPKDSDFFVYKRIHNKWENILLVPNSSISNFIGLKRDARAQGSEYALLCKDIDLKKWLDCNEGVNIFSCIESNLNVRPIIVKNIVPSPSIEGEVWIVSKPMIPWAWGRHTNINMSAKYLKLYVVIDK